MTQENKSIRSVVITAAILVAYLGWGFMAGSYAGSSGGAEVMTAGGRTNGRLLLISAVFSFIVTSITQIPRFFTIISWHISNRIWLPILFIVLEAAVLAGGYGLKKLEENLSKPPGRRKR